MQDAYTRDEEIFHLYHIKVIKLYIVCCPALGMSLRKDLM